MIDMNAVSKQSDPWNPQSSHLLPTAEAIVFAPMCYSRQIAYISG